MTLVVSYITKNNAIDVLPVALENSHGLGHCDTETPSLGWPHQGQ
jgi:hypothetical protein